MSKGSIALVTGGAGFIGSHMVDLLLERGYQVRVVDNLVGGRRENLKHHQDNPNLVFQLQDLRETAPDDPLFDGVEYVFHFAGIGDIVPSIEKPAEYLSANIMGTVHALEAARAVRPKLRYTAGGLANRLRLLRRFAPSGLIDTGIRKDLRLEA